MRTDGWGAQGWSLTHDVVHAYPISPSEKQQRRMSKFIQLLPKILPCIFCRRGSRKHLKTLMWKHRKFIYLASQESLEKFMWQLHNLVNKSLGKPEIRHNQIKYTNIWQQWDFFSCVARDFPLESKKTHYHRRFIHLLCYLFPGKEWRRCWRKALHDLQWKRNKDIFTRDRESFSHFMWMIQNVVKEQLQKEKTVSYFEWKTNVEQLRASGK